MSWVRIVFSALLIVGGVANAQSQDPASTRDANAIEQDVQAVAKTVRCVVCKNQSIADSEAPLAQDMVAVVREKIEAGATPDEARDYLVDRYGEFVLLQPTLSAKNIGLWGGPAVMLLIGVGLAGWFIGDRRRALQTAETSRLSAEEREELGRLLAKARVAAQPFPNDGAD